ncbi:hypothetical protein [Armatimonas rosea]|uniref:Zf-HC2 domain-containing protein n=1 Tax=Armatimonas rosea TaxID=685828 RepID=A0A7W9W679_ARMRO|nr:hypothetical protein [Armatimonas rosea]MBB6049307.1 hypothetical protein [Armatimonas rosea]
MTTPCKIAPETLTALHESALPWWQALALKSHTRRCTSCQAQLAHCIALDTQLRTLAPIPAELTQSLVQKHRRLLLGSSLVLALLGAGTWRFFTPEITWADVERAMKQVESVHWKRTIRQERIDPLPVVSALVRLSDRSLNPPAPTFTYSYSYQKSPAWHQGDYSDPYFDSSPRPQLDNLDAVINRDWTTLHPLLPDAHQHHFSPPKVQWFQGKRALVFTRKINLPKNMYNYTSLGIEEDTVIVDPQTRHIVWRNRVFTSAESKSDFKISDTCERISYSRISKQVILQKNLQTNEANIIRNSISDFAKARESSDRKNTSFTYQLLRSIPANKTQDPNAVAFLFRVILEFIDTKQRQTVKEHYVLRFERSGSGEFTLVTRPLPPPQPLPLSDAPPAR